MKPATLLVAVLATWLISGCGSPSSPVAPASSPSPASSAVPSTAATQPGCDLAPASLVKAQLALTVNDPIVTTSASVTTCAYAVGSNPFGVIIRFQVRQDQGSFAAGRAAFPSTVDVSGLGDEAYSSVANNYSTLVARKGSNGILITSRASVAAERSLMVILLTRV